MTEAIKQWIEAISTERRIQDYLHFYLGCDAQIAVIVPGQELSWELDKLNIRWLHGSLNKLVEVKPILRPLSDMTGKEILEVFHLSYADAKYTFSEYDNVNNNDFGWRARNQNGMECFVPANSFKPEVFRWLLSKGIDLFNLIPDGLAINKTTLKP